MIKSTHDIDPLTSSYVIALEFRVIKMNLEYWNGI